MAESLSLFFRGATWAQLAEYLARHATAGSAPETWAYPPAPGEPTVLLYRYDTPDLYLLDEYESADRAALLAALARPQPSAILTLELRRSTGERAWADAARLATALLRQFDGVADDVHNRVWTLAEIEAGARKDGRRFLEHPGAPSETVDRGLP